MPDSHIEMVAWLVPVRRANALWDKCLVNRCERSTRMIATMSKRSTAATI
ncbi:hypothetical protein NE857_22145 [Nocardiopsis exhalans]|uniref:Uncharacterized protein n=2 Tax=Nocardiopsis TaxID=2013 RepID=A0A840WEN4_9ACTN|nr:MULTISPECIES: hypothetical protein [Nocardiopsis]MBB5491471.1 hypothetical protein [Nocardiopsis metallicus]USY18019.1 hypothetical protein NE857_22145 [Nocardiopsis exhalans]